MSGNKAMKRAMETKDFIRVNGGVPLIVDTTELITAAIAHEMLKHNKYNRPVNWRAVEEFADIMSRGEWTLHPQGIVFDSEGNLLTGQKRLWAIIYSDTAILMRVSRGCPAKAAWDMDRGVPQTSQDLATRETERKHSPYEVNFARGMLVLQGFSRPSKDQIARLIISKADVFAAMIMETKGTKKTRSVLMILSAIGFLCADATAAKEKAKQAERYAAALDFALSPGSAEQCWGRGAAFSVAMGQAKKCVEG